jgi:hypothetical protein
MRVAGSLPGSSAGNSLRYHPRGLIAAGFEPRAVLLVDRSPGTSRKSPHVVVASGAKPECMRSEACGASAPRYQ